MSDTFCGATHRPVRNRRRRNRRQDISPLGISATTQQRQGIQRKVRGGRLIRYISAMILNAIIFPPFLCILPPFLFILV
jgi:hypothetical protein